jgi:hypothetical protein
MATRFPRLARPSAGSSALAGAGLALAACTDFASPAELNKATILAVTADPPIVAPGAQASLAVAIADGGGLLEGLPVRWSLIETYRGVPAMGTLVGSTYTAPDPVPPLPENAPPIDSVRLEIDVGETTLAAIKVVPVAAIAGAANPAITALAVGDADGLAGPLTVARGATLALAVATEPAPGDDARFAWYSSAGAIERYQSNPTTMIADDEVGDGWLFVVVRDGQGGVAWRGVEVSVE